MTTVPVSTVDATPAPPTAWTQAVRQHERNVAEAFTQRAYASVEHGLIRLDERQRLAALAADMGIRPFDAQLLIACAIRRWALDHRYLPVPSPKAPRLSFEYKAWWRGWMRFGMVAATAAGLDAVILWGWLRGW